MPMSGISVEYKTFDLSLSPLSFAFFVRERQLTVSRGRQKPTTHTTHAACPGWRGRERRRKSGG